MELIAFNASSIGASHIRVGKECQDYSFSEVNERYCVAITCDGHGGDNYFRSSLGSEFAAKSAASCIEEFLDACGSSALDKPDEALVQLEKSIIASWNAKVWEHFEANPFSEEELDSVSESRKSRLLSGKSIESTYGTTLIAMAWTSEYWFALQIGDGKAVRINADGTADCPVPVNDKCFLNTTTSICDANALENFRHFYSTELPAGVFCGSDGIDDSFIRDDQLYKLYLTIGRSFTDSDYEAAKSELEDYLPRLSSKGSGDDVSIAGIIDLSISGEAFPEIEEPDAKPETEEAASDGECESSDPVVSLETLTVDSVEEGQDVDDDPIEEHEQIESEETDPQADDALQLEDSERSDIADLDNLPAYPEPESDSEEATVGKEDLEGSDRSSSDYEPSDISPEEESEEYLYIEEVKVVVVEKDGSVDSAQKTVCPNCGAETKGDFKFCPNCATPLTD